MIKKGGEWKKSVSETFLKYRTFGGRHKRGHWIAVVLHYSLCTTKDHQQNMIYQSIKSKFWLER